MTRPCFITWCRWNQPTAPDRNLLILRHDAVLATHRYQQQILECAVAAGSDVIVTGDAHLLQLGAYRGIKIMKVADFLGQARDR